MTKPVNVSTTGGTILNSSAAQNINIIPGCNTLYMSQGLVTFDFQNDTIYNLYINFNIYCGIQLYDFIVPPGGTLLKAGPNPMTVGKATYNGMINIWAALPTGGYNPQNPPANQLTVVGYAKGNYGPPVLVPTNRTMMSGNLIAAQQVYRQFNFETNSPGSNTVFSETIPSPGTGFSIYIVDVYISCNAFTAACQPDLLISPMDTSFNSSLFLSFEESGAIGSAFNVSEQYQAPMKGQSGSALTVQFSNFGTTIVNVTGRIIYFEAPG